MFAMTSVIEQMPSSKRGNQRVSEKYISLSAGEPALQFSGEYVPYSGFLLSALVAVKWKVMILLQSLHTKCPVDVRFQTAADEEHCAVHEANVVTRE